MLEDNKTNREVESGNVGNGRGEQNGEFAHVAPTLEKSEKESNAFFILYLTLERPNPTKNDGFQTFLF